eukprot:1147255-Pelagomonas_calceolata.AAC.5
MTQQLAYALNAFVQVSSRSSTCRKRASKGKERGASQAYVPSILLTDIHHSHSAALLPWKGK